MIWLSPQNLQTINTKNDLEQLSRQWGMTSSLLLVSVTILLFTMELNSQPMASKNPEDNVVNLEYRIVQPQPEVPQQPLLTEQFEPQPEPAPVPKEPVVQRGKKFISEPEPPQVVQQVIEKHKPLIPKKIKPSNKKRKVIQQQKPIKPQVKPQVAVQPPPVEATDIPLQPTEIVHEPSAYEQSMVDMVPAAINKIRPAYPRRARRMHVTGFVEIRFLVNKNGLVDTMKIIRARPEGVFEKSVHKAVMSWQFSPGIKNGQNVSTWVTTTINYKLE